MGQVKLTDRKIKDQDVEIFATSDGTFVATVNGEQVEKPSLQQLVDRIGVLLEKRVIPVDVMLLDRPGWHEKNRTPVFKTVKLTGIHSANDYFLIKIGEGSSSRQLISRDALYVALTKEQQAEYFALEAVVVAASKAIDDWCKKYSLTVERGYKLLGLTQTKREDC